MKIVKRVNSIMEVIEIVLLFKTAEFQCVQNRGPR